MRDRPDETDAKRAWTAPQIEMAVKAVLMDRFPDWTISGIKIDEGEASQLARHVTSELRDHRAFAQTRKIS